MRQEVKGISFDKLATSRTAADAVSDAVASRAHGIQPTAGVGIQSTTATELLLMGCVAMLLRAALFLAAGNLHGWSLSEFAGLRDGASYVHYAEWLRGNSGAMSSFDHRVFPGYPALIALLSLTGASVPLAAVLLTWLSTAVTAVLTAVLYDDRRMGWAMVVLTPSYLMYSTMVMSEGVLLAFTVAGLVLVYRARSVGGGVLLGFAGLVRPMACFAVLGAAFDRMRTKRTSTITICVVSASIVAAALLALHLLTGDAAQNVKIYASDDKAYAGQLFAVPFESLVMTPLRTHVPLWKVAYIWCYVLLTLAACVIVARNAFFTETSEQGAAARLNAPWLIGNTIFVLCVGHIWGFHEFHRFILPALPPLLWAFREYYPRRWRGWSAVAACSFVVALVGLLRSA